MKKFLVVSDCDLDEPAEFDTAAQVALFMLGRDTLTWQVYIRGPKWVSPDIAEIKNQLKQYE